MRVIVVGPSWYGNWVDYFYEALITIHADAKVIYTNTLAGSSLGYGSDATMRTFEKIKKVILKVSPKLFGFLKGVRRAMSEKDLLRQIEEMGEKKKIVVLFVWTPPGIKILKKLSTRDNIKTVYWIGEPLSRNAKWRSTLKYFDHLFLIDSPEWSGDLTADEVKKSSLLPLSSTPKVFKPLESVDEKYLCDVAFVGLYRKERAEMIESIKDYNFKVYGFGWEEAEKEFPWLSGKVMGSAQLEEMNEIFNGAKISIGSLGVSFVENLPTLTQRVFDIALGGGFQLSQWNPLTEKVFGGSVPLFKSTEDLAEKLDYYMKHTEERERLAKESYEIALKSTWEDRAREVLHIFDSLVINKE